MNSSAESPGLDARDDQVEHQRLHGDVERGRRLVADQQGGVVGERDGEDHPLALAAGELVRVGAGRSRRVGQADLAEQLDGGRLRAARRGSGAVPWISIASATCSPTRIVRVQRGHRLLEHHRDVAPAHPRTAAARRRRRRSRSTPASRTEPVAVQALGQQAHERQRGQRLARPGLADQPDPLAAAGS